MQRFWSTTPQNFWHYLRENRIEIIYSSNYYNYQVHQAVAGTFSWIKKWECQTQFLDGFSYPRKFQSCLSQQGIGKANTYITLLTEDSFMKIICIHNMIINSFAWAHTITIFEKDGNGKGADLVLYACCKGWIYCADNAKCFHHKIEDLRTKLSC